MHQDVSEKLSVVVILRIVYVLFGNGLCVMIDGDPNLVEQTSLPLKPDEFLGIGIDTFRLLGSLHSAQHKRQCLESGQHDASPHELAPVVLRLAHPLHHDYRLDVSLHVGLAGALAEQCEIEAQSRGLRQPLVVDVLPHELPLLHLADYAVAISVFVTSVQKFLVRRATCFRHPVLLDFFQPLRHNVLLSTDMCHLELFPLRFHVGVLHSHVFPVA